MKKLLPALFILFSLAGYSQPVIHPDSLIHFPNYYTEGWKYIDGDDIRYASPDLDDTQWKVTESTLNISLASTPAFSGRGWFRLHVTVDSSLAGKPLVMTITQHGASEIY